MSGVARRGGLLVAAVSLLVLMIFFVACLDERVWEIFGIHHLTPYFSDLVAVLAAGDARQAGLDIYARINPLDPFGRPHVYGPWWTLTSAVGLTRSDAWWLGLLLILAFVGTAALVLRPRTMRGAVIASLLLCAPPVLLGLERGNNDLIIFLLIAIAGWMVNRTRGGAAAAAITLAAALKIYPIAALPALAAGRITRKAMWVSLVGTAVLCAAIAAIWWHDYRAALALAPRPTTIFAYGLDVSLRTWAGLPERHLAVAFGAIIAMAAGGFALIRGGEELWRAVPLSGTAAAFFVSGTAMWCFCYLATINYPYRLVLLFFPARLWLQEDSGAITRSARWQLAGWLAVLWITVPKRLLAMNSIEQPDGSVPTWLAVTVGFEQALVVVLTLALMVGLGGWLARRCARQPDSVTES
jgi:hypothetical protein